MVKSPSGIAKRDRKRKERNHSLPDNSRGIFFLSPQTPPLLGKQFNELLTNINIYLI